MKTNIQILALFFALWPCIMLQKRNKTGICQTIGLLDDYFTMILPGIYKPDGNKLLSTILGLLSNGLLPFPPHKHISLKANI